MKLLLWRVVMVTLVLSRVSSVTRGEGYCVTYSDCGGVPCVNNTPAKPISSYQTLSSLREFCPHLKEESGFCCDAEQVTIMEKALSKADNLLKCTPGRDNFRTLICDMVCGPNQANYLEITESKQYGDRIQATHIKYFISTEYSDAVWRSTRKQSKLLCGKIFSECSKQDLFKFIGDNRWTKLKTDYVIENTPSRPGIKHSSPSQLACPSSSSCQC
ncbi:NPC1-like intracellular cholesterol transporter 1 [Bolinopsis microptera]|uniref:NPC1-like intracellular cholesterol transporter 1 n=1 Tax=Bolinopsis microptera TaxID=2820187 RepID=UPI003078B035